VEKLSDRPNVGTALVAIGTFAKVVQAFRGHGVFCNCKECAPINFVTLLGIVGDLLS